jgi:arginine decarboxylase
MAINEESQSSYYTSRLGIRHNDILKFYMENIKGKENRI